MKKPPKFVCPLVIALITFVLLAEKTNADVLLTYEDTDNGLLVSWSGSLNLTNLTYVNSFSSALHNIGDFGSSETIRSWDSSDWYRDTTLGGQDFVTTTSVYTSGGVLTGDSFGIYTSSSYFEVYVPSGYSSGDSISGSSLWNDLNAESIGFIDQTISWGAGENKDSITIAAVPEPGTIGLLGIFASGLLFIRRRFLN